MNKILHLLDEEFALNYLRKKALPLYPQFTDITRVKIRPYKKMIWETTYHVVIGFEVYFLDVDYASHKISIVCSAHSSEARANVYKALNYFWEHHFNDDNVRLPRPLFFSQGFNGTFYEALEGENLLHYIKKNNAIEIEQNIIAAANLFSKLHSLTVTEEANFNPLNARIKTVIPGVNNILKEMTDRYGEKYAPDLKKFYDYFITQEEVFFSKNHKLCLIHGDAHPENVIRTSPDSIGIIDFTDLCLGDFARDLGTFTQQLEYKIMAKIGNQEFADKMQKLFLDTYFKAAGLVDSVELEARRKLYYNWTAIRTATYLFLKFGHNEEQANALFQKVKQNLNL